ncbi:MAG: Na+-translocating ferredoxin:NAD+ oxidoreductase subunit G [Thiomicrorhabdus sp.]|nr:MAG: Na+-translocating ferredoxin:NAD+ oxidoreductase subunit G [Thiomicrorhabdus sp.]
MTTSSNTAPQTLIKGMFNSAYKLSFFIFISIICLLAIQFITAPQIAHEEREAMLMTFNKVLPSEYYNNNPLSDTTTLTNPSQLAELGSDEPVIIYRARKDNQPAGLIFTLVAPNGYSGNITLLMGVFPDGSVSGVRALKHRETPGLGDKIDEKKYDWILSFSGKSINFENDSDHDDDHRWAVKKDGGEFDQFTGATITPRAVIGAVKKALLFVNEQGGRLYE